MGDWTHFTATVTICNSGDVRPLIYLKQVERFQKQVKSKEATWEDVEMRMQDIINTTSVWHHFIQKSFIPKVTSTTVNLKYFDEMPSVSFYYQGIDYDIIKHPVPCPFKSYFPLEHHCTELKFYKNISPDGQFITFTYEGDVEENVSFGHIDDWVKSLEDCYIVRSGVVAVYSTTQGNKVWTLGRVR